jgi:hypothetical protein
MSRLGKFFRASTRARELVLERDDIAIAQPSRSNFLFDRVIQTFGDSAYSHHALALAAPCRRAARHGSYPYNSCLLSGAWKKTTDPPATAGSTGGRTEVPEGVVAAEGYRPDGTALSGASYFRRQPSRRAYARSAGNTDDDRPATIIRWPQRHPASAVSPRLSRASPGPPSVLGGARITGGSVVSFQTAGATQPGPPGQATGSHAMAATRGSAKRTFPDRAYLISLSSGKARA